jgi:hypothetical protein
VSERAQIGRVLTVERPAWPKALIARLVGVSRQSLYHREPVESVEPVDDGVGGVPA